MQYITEGSASEPHPTTHDLICMCATDKLPPSSGGGEGGVPPLRQTSQSAAPSLAGDVTEGSGPGTAPPAGAIPAGGGAGGHRSEADTIGLDGPAPPGGALPASASTAVSSVSDGSAVMIDVGRNSSAASVVSRLTEGGAPDDRVVEKQARALGTVREGSAAAGGGPGGGGPSEDGVAEKQARALETVSGDRPPPATTERRTVIGAVHVPGIGSSPAADAGGAVEGPAGNEEQTTAHGGSIGALEERHVTEAYAVDDEGPPPPGPSVLDLPSAVEANDDVAVIRAYTIVAKVERKKNKRKRRLKRKRELARDTLLEPPPDSDEKGIPLDLRGGGGSDELSR